MDLLLVVVESSLFSLSTTLTQASEQMEGRSDCASLWQAVHPLVKGHEHPFCLLLAL